MNWLSGDRLLVVKDSGGQSLFNKPTISHQRKAKTPQSIMMLLYHSTIMNWLSGDRLLVVKDSGGQSFFNKPTISHQRNAKTPQSMHAGAASQHPCCLLAHALRYYYKYDEKQILK